MGSNGFGFGVGLALLLLLLLRNCASKRKLRNHVKWTTKLDFAAEAIGERREVARRSRRNENGKKRKKESRMKPSAREREGEKSLSPSFLLSIELGTLIFWWFAAHPAESPVLGSTVRESSS